MLVELEEVTVGSVSGGYRDRGIERLSWKKLRERRRVLHFQAESGRRAEKFQPVENMKK